MKIAIMSRWNATCGVSLHAEIISREFRKLGHKVIIYAPTLESACKDWHHKPLPTKDEDWVKRVYEETNEFYFPYGGRIDMNEVLSEDYDVFIIEGYQRFPVQEFRKIVHRIRKSSILVLIVHVGLRRDIEPYLEIPWDAIVVFDERFINELLRPYGEEVINKTVVIPYPYLVLSDVEPYRPNFADGKILVITYGRQPLCEYYDYIRALRRLVMDDNYNIVYWIVRSDSPLPINYEWIKQENTRLDLRTIYSFVMGADMHLIPKSETKAVVVSSTLAQVLYTGTPTIVPNTRYFETIPVSREGFGPVVKYELGDTTDLYRKLKLLIENEELRNEVSQAAKSYALRFRSEVICKRFIELFKVLIYEGLGIKEFIHTLKTN